MKMSQENLKPTLTDAKFWDNKWNIGDIFFHTKNNHPFLVKNLPKLVEENEKLRILFPFCGKAVDMAWLDNLSFILKIKFIIC